MTDNKKKEVYQNILGAYDRYLLTGEKQVVIVEGESGVGKTAMALKAFIEMLRRKLLTKYVSNDKQSREELFVKFMKYPFKYLFTSAEVYYDRESNEFDMLLADDAHCLREHKGPDGDHQIKDIINAAKVSVFFIDEKRIEPDTDLGSISTIESLAREMRAEVRRLSLTI